MESKIPVRMYYTRYYDIYYFNINKNYFLK